MIADQKTCAREGCTNVARRRGLCDRHAYQGEQVVEQSAPTPTPAVQIAEDMAKLKATSELAGLRTRYKEALKTIEQQQAELRAMNVLGQGVDSFAIEPYHSAGVGEATVVVVASDWHCEETVGDEIGGLNVYNPQIAKLRATQFFQKVLRLTRLFQQDVRIDRMVLALLGDFITGNIHGEENAEKNDLTPNHAIVFAMNLIIAGIEFLISETTLEFVVPCHSGNHARTTHTTRFGSESGHSLEYLMYLHLAAHFRSEPRVTFIIPESMHSYVGVYDTTIRFHHGHAVKYGGGVGGIYIPVNKAVSQWNKGKHADLDVFGHFHQSRDGGNFICNGSMIGYNSYALSIKADYDRPSQTMFIIDKKRGRTFTMPVLFSR